MSHPVPAASLLPPVPRTAPGMPAHEAEAASPMPANAALFDLPTLRLFPRPQRDAALDAEARPAEETPVQPELEVGPADDQYEREADDIADTVLRMPDDGGASVESAPAGVQRKCAACEAEDKIQRETLAQVEAKTGPPTIGASPATLTSGGSPLADGVRGFYEQRLGRDLAAVRIHDGPPARGLNDSISARAFTYRSHIWLGEGRADTPSRTLSHEMAHVLQQTQPGLMSAVRRSIMGDAGRWVAHRILSPEMRGFLRDLVASIREAPLHATEILGEVWQSIVAHWVSFLAVFLGFLAAQAAVGGLAAAPDPTFLTKLLAFVLQALILAAVGYFAAVETGQVMSWAVAWWQAVAAAGGDPARISEASRAFCRMLLHVALLVLTLVGVRARAGAAVRSGRSLPGELFAGATSRAAGGSIKGGAGAAGGGAQMTAAPPVAVPPQLTGLSGGGVRTPVASTSGGFDGSAARALAPEVVPARPPLRLVPNPPLKPVAAPIAAEAPPAPVVSLPSVGTAAAAAASTVTPDAPSCPAAPPGQHVQLVLPPQKAIHAGLYRQFIGRRELQHRVGRGRDTEQREKWNRMMLGGEMQSYVSTEGRRMGLCERQILRPSWTLERLWPDTQVDHIIEHQTAPIGREAQFDEPWNFELLDQASNAASGRVLDSNILGERKRLVAATGNAAWAICDLTFTQLVAPPAAPAGRWSAQDVGDGRHLRAFRRLGLAPEDVC